MDEQQLDNECLVAFSAVYEAIKMLPQERQQRVLQSVAILLDIVRK